MSDTEEPKSAEEKVLFSRVTSSDDRTRISKAGPPLRETYHRYRRGLVNYTPVSSWQRVNVPVLGRPATAPVQTPALPFRI